MPRSTPRPERPENPAHRGETTRPEIGGILGPREQEIAAAARNLSGDLDAALRQLASQGRFGIARPRPTPDKFGAEHDVFLSDDGRRVFKHARCHGFGPAMADGCLAMVRLSADGYLARHALMEQIFPTRVRIEGLTPDGHFVISQRAIRGEHPTVAAVRRFLSGAGFVNIPPRFGQAGNGWFHRGMGVIIIDAAPDNFISSARRIVPIDLQIAELCGPLALLADEVDEFSRKAPDSGP